MEKKNKNYYAPSCQVINLISEGVLAKSGEEIKQSRDYEIEEADIETVTW